MNKKSIGVFLIILLIVLGVGFMFHSGFFNNDKISVGEMKFSIPEGYHKLVNNSANDLNLSNGYNSIFFVKYEGKNVNKSINEMNEFIKNQNRTPILSNFTVNDTLVYKVTIVNDTQYYRYWFVDGNSTYCIYTWDGNTNTDNLVTTLINSRSK